mmetsp:Transcript_134715/g.430381  ORF Transcript_134715/g.430381 Transcript_134715/m.430381 type:complete len:221 (-) Transcript_134715:2-664(-)
MHLQGIDLLLDGRPRLLQAALRLRRVLFGQVEDGRLGPGSDEVFHGGVVLLQASLKIPHLLLLSCPVRLHLCHDSLLGVQQTFRLQPALGLDQVPHHSTEQSSATHIGLLGDGALHQLADQGVCIAPGLPPAFPNLGTLGRGRRSHGRAVCLNLGIVLLLGRLFPRRLLRFRLVARGLLSLGRRLFVGLGGHRGLPSCPSKRQTRRGRAAPKTPGAGATA